MEKTTRAAVVPVKCGWSDVGSWHAVWELSDKDSQGNAAQGAAGVEDFPNLHVSTEKARAALGGARRCSRIPATATFQPIRHWSRWKASTIWWWWRCKTPSWCRVRRT